MPSTLSTIICVCWWVVLGVITAPSFVQVTVVAGPPVEVQVRVLDPLSNVSSVTLGAPAHKQGQELRNCTLYYIPLYMFWEVYHFSKSKLFSVRIQQLSCSKSVCVHVMAWFAVVFGINKAGSNCMRHSRVSFTALQVLLYHSKPCYHLLVLYFIIRVQLSSQQYRDEGLEDWSYWNLKDMPTFVRRYASLVFMPAYTSACPSSTQCHTANTTNTAALQLTKLPYFQTTSGQSDGAAFTKYS